MYNNETPSVTLSAIETRSALALKYQRYLEDLKISVQDFSKEAEKGKPTEEALWHNEAAKDRNNRHVMSQDIDDAFDPDELDACRRRRHGLLVRPEAAARRRDAELDARVRRADVDVPAELMPTAEERKGGEARSEKRGARRAEESERQEQEKRTNRSRAMESPPPGGRRFEDKEKDGDDVDDRTTASASPAAATTRGPGRASKVQIERSVRIRGVEGGDGPRRVPRVPRGRGRYKSCWSTGRSTRPYDRIQKQTSSPMIWTVHPDDGTPLEFVGGSDDLMARLKRQKTNEQTNKRTKNKRTKEQKTNEQKTNEQKVRPQDRTKNDIKARRLYPFLALSCPWLLSALALRPSSCDPKTI